MSKITHRAFGVEQEHFIFDQMGFPPTHTAIDRLWESFICDGYEVRATSKYGSIISIQESTDFGVLIITNDACTNIIEVAFPKMNSIAAFRKLYSDTWKKIEEKLQKLGLIINYGGILPRAPEKINWRWSEKDPDGNQLKTFLNREKINTPLFCSEIPACIAATQVSLEIPKDEAIEKLDFFYFYEHLIPKNFSNSKNFQNNVAHCIRPLAILANFHQPYPLLGIPDVIPRNLAEYAQMRSETPGRDYSFVSIRENNRIEFRSACSQDTIDDVERLVQFRLALDLKIDTYHSCSAHLYKTRFLDCCQFG
jgi:hypothetical protein